MDTNRKEFILAYGTTLMDGGHIYKYLGKLLDKTSTEKELSG